MSTIWHEMMRGLAISKRTHLPSALFLIVMNNVIYNMIMCRTELATKENCIMLHFLFIFLIDKFIICTEFLIEERDIAVRDFSEGDITPRG